jgi:hypothetical protein
VGSERSASLLAKTFGVRSVAWLDRACPYYEDVAEKENSATPAERKHRFASAKTIFGELAGKEHVVEEGQVPRRDSASPWVEDGISWTMGNRVCQTFAIAWLRLSAITVSVIMENRSLLIALNSILAVDVHGHVAIKSCLEVFKPAGVGGVPSLGLW